MAYDVDNYNGFNGTSSTYTVQRDGLYLVHGIVSFVLVGTTQPPLWLAGTRVAGISINGTIYWGPGYTATVNGVNCTKTQIFTLFTGDVVKLVCRQDSGAVQSISTASNSQSRLFMVWLSGPPMTGSYGFEDGNAQGWSGTNAVAVPSTSWSQGGLSSLKVIAAGGPGNWLASSPFDDVPVTPGDTVSVSAFAYVPASLTDIGMSLDWFGPAGYISTSSSMTQTTASGQVVLLNANGAAPANATTVRLNVVNQNVSPAGTMFFIDEVVWSRWTEGVSWTPPDTTFRWSSGTLGPDLPDLFQQHIANDLSFLVHKPYFEAYQATAQSSLAVGIFSTVNLDIAAGIVHSEPSDPYEGITSPGFPHYTAPVNGWYLVVGEVFAASSSAVGSTVIGAILAPTSGGRSPNTSPDWFQQLTATSNADVGGGATVFGTYFLLAGETVTLQIQANAYSGPYSTLTGTHNGGIVASHLEGCWISE